MEWDAAVRLVMLLLAVLVLPLCVRHVPHVTIPVIRVVQMPHTPMVVGIKGSI